MGTEAIQAGGAEVEVRVRDRLKEQLPKIAERFRQTGEHIKKIGAGMAASSAAGMALFSTAAKSFADAGSELLGMSQRTGVAVEILSELQYAAAKTGATMSDVEEVVTAIKEGKQLELWSSSSAGVIRLLTSNIGALRREARALGADMSGQTAASALELANAFKTSAFVVSTVWRELGAAVAPTVTNITRRMTAMVEPFINFIRNNRELVRVLFVVLSTIAQVGTTLAVLGAVIEGASVAIAFLGGAFVPLLAGAVILSTVAAVAYHFRDVLLEVWRAVAREIAPVINGVRQLYTVFSTMIGGIVMALGSGQFEAAAAIAWAGLVAAGWTGVEQLAAAVDAGIEYLKQYIPGIDSVVSYFQDAFGGLYDAVMAGRWDLAGQILMAKLQLVWAEGIGFLQDVWDMFTVGLQQSFSGVSQFISKVWHGAIDGIARSIAWVMEKTGLATEGTLAALEKMQAAEAKQRAQQANLDPTTQMQQRMLAREAERNKLRTKISGLEGQAKQAYQQAGSPTVADVAEDARRRLRAEIAKAKRGRKDDAKEIPGPGIQDEPISLPKYKTEGSFTAAAAVVLGNGGNVNEKIEQNTRAMAKGIASINDNTKRRGKTV